MVSLVLHMEIANGVHQIISFENKVTDVESESEFQWLFSVCSTWDRPTGLTLAR